ncbi:hypothetical protein [uncultured Algimonas sp.]|uniref:hypothetical protein n=1 Tax=uncultured Algimonas sp. TaxID=1547920 RepID=UPI002618C43E|nr:hypothetical protein [uncultured Algimonas sp.]
MPERMTESARSRAAAAERRREAKAKFKRYALWYVAISLPICLLLMFWPMAENVTIHGKLAHYVAIPLAFLSGLFFMGVIFFSSHSGADEQPNYVKMMEEQERRKREGSS